jgi:hypothetical protein|nr:MAG TPA: hypothetical protein [Caudoviricetes sp.]
MLLKGQELFNELINQEKVVSHTLIIKNKDLELDGRIFPLEVLKDKITAPKRRTMSDGYFFCERLPERLSYHDDQARYEYCDFNNYFFRIKELNIIEKEDGTILEATIESSEDNIKEIIDEYKLKGTSCFFIRCRFIGKPMGDGTIAEDIDFSHIDFIKK